MKSERKRYFGKRKEKALIFTALFVMLAFLTVGCASATTHYVNPGELIQDAVDAASDGDTIIVRDGTYIENVDVNKRLTIKSENGSENCVIQSENPNDHVFEVTADYVNISGFTVANSYYSCIYLDSVEHSTISNNNISNSTDGSGIELEYCHDISIYDNSISSNYYDGIFMFDTYNNTIANNTLLSNHHNGIWMENSTNNTISNNIASMNDHNGIGMRDCSYTNITGNTLLANSYHGIYMKDSHQNTISNNNASHSIVWNGMALQNCSYTTITGNMLVSNNRSGIRMENSTKNIISNNNAFNNSWGISLHYSINNRLVSNIASSNKGDEKGDGINLFSSYNNIVSDNNASGNIDTGIQVMNSSDGNVVTNNIANLNGYCGISVWYSNNNSITNNTANSNNETGIWLNYSSNNQLTNNTASNNGQFGIWLMRSPHNTLRENIMDHNGFFNLLHKDTPTLEEWNNDIDTSNTVNGLPIYYIYNQSDLIIDNYTTKKIVVVGGTNVTVRNITYSDGDPIGLIFTNDSLVENCTVTNNNAGGFLLIWSHYNRLVNNTAGSNKGTGMVLQISSYNILSHNTINSNNATGMAIQSGDYNMISDNIAILNAGDGIWLWNSSNNMISGNNASNNTVHNGISLGASHNNTVVNNIAYSNYHNGINLYNGSGNNIVANNTLVCNEAHGISAHDYSNFNKIYHNNLINNSQNAIDESLNNSWDNGYPSGGNYWSDYTGVDNYSGPKQDIPGSDGIGDTPYNIPGGVGAKDHYPLMNPYSEKDIFDTGTGTYPSIMGTHKGTIIPSRNVNVSRLYTYPCVGTGGHTESIELYENGNLIASGTWNGYVGDWHNITITPPVTLLTGHMYNYTIVTGSYPQIIHVKSKDVTGGTITCTKFTDANGKEYNDWIPAIRLE
jgi:parallel beta-helix repeat protein